MDRKDLTRAGVAAAVLIVPGGFVLGAVLLARSRARRRRAEAEKPAPEPD